MKYLKYILISSALTAAPAWADEAAEGPAARDTQIVVLATGSDVPISQTGQSIAVIGREEIASIQGADITRVLERAAGVTFSRNGGPGGFTGLRVRGAEGEQVLVMVDGVRVADVASPGGGFDFGNLLSGNIGKVEVLRGSNSVVWGSRAIGGVVAVTTREVDGIEAGAEYGSNETIYATAGAGVVRDNFSAGINAGYHDTDGISSAAVGTEPDGFRQWEVSGKARLAVSEAISLLANARFADGTLDIDGFPPPNYSFADTAEFQKQREWSGRVGAEYKSGPLDLYAGYSLQDTRRRLVDPDASPDPYFTSKGRDERAELRGRYRFGTALALDFGAEHDWSTFATGPSFGAAGKVNQSSGHALLGWYGDVVTLAAGARYDDNSLFGDEWTFGANGSVKLAEDWRIRASYGEGFKAPTLYQLLSEYGNPALAPERSRSYDIGIERGDRNGALHIAVTAFRRDTRDQIDFVSCFSVASPLCDDGRFGFYDNIARTRATGFEVELGTQVSERLRAQAAYSYVETENRSPGSANLGNDLARRPRHAVTLLADWRTPLHDLMLGGDIRLVGDSFDNAANSSRLDGYALFTLRASLPVSEAIELFGRVENVTDEDYQTAAGYGAMGRSAYIGAKARF